MDWVEKKKEDGYQREIAEPHNVAHGQDPVEPESCAADFYQVHLAHFIQEVEQDEEAVGQVESTHPALVAVIEAQGQGVHLLRYLQVRAA